MTAIRLIPLPIHAALEMAGGLALMVAPFALGLSTAGIALGVVIGALVVGLALQSVDADGRGLAVSAHHSADYGVALGLAGISLVLAATDPAASLFFGAAAVLQVSLNLLTRYSRR